MDASTGSGSSSPAARCARTWTSKIRSIHKTASRNPLQAASNVATSLLFRKHCVSPRGSLHATVPGSTHPGLIRTQNLLKFPIARPRERRDASSIQVAGTRLHENSSFPKPRKRFYVCQERVALGLNVNDGLL